MAATVHVIARFVAKPGKEEALQAALTALVPPARREIGCYQYDLLSNANDGREFCYVERWGDNKALDEHLATAHVKAMLAKLEGLVEGPPDIRRYTLV
jgi:quinol monooxygenase YgiN